MTKPKLKIKPGFIDYLFEMISLIVLFSIVIITIINYSDLSETIPTHFNLFGIADSYGSKVNLWLFPFIAVIAYAGFTILVRFPHAYNYPVQITEYNAEKSYKIGIRVMRVLKVLFLVLLLYIILKKVL